MPVTPFVDLPTAPEDQGWNPNNAPDSDLKNAILGDPAAPDWVRYKKANLWWDGTGGTRDAYKLKIARMFSADDPNNVAPKKGHLTVIWRMVASRMGILMGARAGVDLPESDRRPTYDHLVKYYKKFDKEPPPFALSSSMPTAGADSSPVTLYRVPTRLGRLTFTDDAAAQTSRSWIQVLAVGDYTHGAYGKFSITSAMLRTMVRNFAEGRHPVDPTELCVDYDHLSEDPPHAGDGKAAGWVRALELRGDDGELWAEIEWTPPAAEAIRNKEYRYISASFNRTFTTPTGEVIGCTLQAIGLTNRPFVQGMAPVSLAVKAMAKTRRDPKTVTLAELSFDERRERISEALESRLGDPDVFDCDHWWYVVDVYDTYAIYRQEGRAYRIAYAIAETGVVTFPGAAEEVTIEYVPLAATPALRTKRSRNMPTIMLKAADGQSVEIDVAALEATELVQELRAKVPAEGAIVVDAQKHAALEASVQTLTETVKTLTTKAAASELKLAERAAIEKIDVLLRAGKIISAQVDTFKALALKDPAMFDTIAATLQPQVKLGGPIGTGADAGADGLPAQEQAIRLASAKRAADPKLSETDAVNAVFTENPALYEQYRRDVSVK